MPRAKRTPTTGCAVTWSVWGAVGYYLERMHLINEGAPAPAHWTLDEWREATRIKQEFKRLVLEEGKR